VRGELQWLEKIPCFELAKDLGPKGSLLLLKSRASRLKAGKPFELNRGGRLPGVAQRNQLGHALYRWVTIKTNNEVF